MVCPRCIMSVEELLLKNNLSAKRVYLGEVELENKPSTSQIKKFSDDLQRVGFELLDDVRSKIIESIKSHLIQLVQDQKVPDHFSIQDFLTKYIFKDYSSLSKLFSQTEGVTIEQFFILQKVEKVKELLLYGEHSLSDISMDLGYSSPQHLSSQFRKITGMTPRSFKSLGNTKRKPIDKVIQ